MAASDFTAKNRAHLADLRGEIERIRELVGVAYENIDKGVVVSALLAEARETVERGLQLVDQITGKEGRS